MTALFVTNRAGVTGCCELALKAITFSVLSALLLEIYVLMSILTHAASYWIKATTVSWQRGWNPDGRAPGEN